MKKLCDFIFRKGVEAGQELIISKRHILTDITVRISKTVSDFFFGNKKVAKIITKIGI